MANEFGSSVHHLIRFSNPQNVELWKIVEEDYRCTHHILRHLIQFYYYRFVYLKTCLLGSSTQLHVYLYIYRYMFSLEMVHVDLHIANIYCAIFQKANIWNGNKVQKLYLYIIKIKGLFGPSNIA